MGRILLFGAAFHDNLGDDLILNCVDLTLTQNNIERSYVVPLTKKLYIRPEQYEETTVPMFTKYKNKGKKIVEILHFLWEKQAFGKYNAFVFYGGGYTNQDFGLKNLIDIYILAKKARKNGLKVYFTGQTVGPCNNKFYCALLKKIYKQANIVFVREQFSFDYLRKVDIKSRLVADDVLLIYPYVNYEIEKRRVIFNYKVYGDSQKEKSKIFEMYRRMAFNCAEDSIITVMPFRSSLDSQEYIANRELYNYLQQAGISVEFNVETSLEGLLKVFTEAKIVVGSAYHSVVLGKICGATVYTTYYDEYYKMKIGGFLGFYNEENNCLPFDEFVELEYSDLKKTNIEYSRRVTATLYKNVADEWKEIIYNNE